MSPNEIKSLRHALGWSQERLAKELCVSFCTVNRWERGKTVPSQLALMSIKKLFDAKMNNKRRSLRLEKHYTLKVEKLWGAVVAESLPQIYSGATTRTENISTDGLMFREAGAYTNGELLRIDIELLSGAVIRTVSEVRWTRENGRGKDIGVFFSKISNEAKGALQGALLAN